MPLDERPSRIAAYESLFLEITKLLAEMQQDAQAHGFDVGPYLDRLASLANLVSPKPSSASLN